MAGGPHRSVLPETVRRVVWFLTLWAGGVATVATVGFLLRLILNA